MKNASTSNLIDTYNNAIAHLNVEEIYSKFPHDFNSDHNGKLRGKPPFRESNSGSSFTVYSDKGFFDAGDGFAGSPADYLHSMSVGRWEKAKGIDFFNVVKILCEKAGIELPEREPNPEDIEKAQQWERRRTLLSHAVDFFQGVLLSPLGDVARDYLNSRNIDDDVIKQLKIGYCHKSLDLFQHLQSKGFSDDEIKSSGVCNKKFEKYISFPWLNVNGKILTIYYRYHQKQPPEGNPKTYALHGERTKSHPFLFDLVVQNNHRECIFVEGLFDAIALQIAGETRGCSGVAASFSNEQIQQLKRHRIEQVYHIGDPDAGGDAGTESNLKRLLDEGINVFIPEKLPDGLDPDEYIKRDGIDALKNRIENAEHGLSWMAKRLISKHGNSDADKIKLIKEAKTWIQSRKKLDPIIVEINYFSILAKHLGISIDAFKDSNNGSLSNNNFDDDYLPLYNQGALAEYFSDKYREKLAWNIELQTWYRYEAENEGIWEPEAVECVKQVINAELKVIAANHNQYINDPSKHKVVSHHLISSIEKLMECELGQKKWNSNDKNLIPFKNGVLNLITKKFTKHCPGNRLTWSLPYEYNLMANCQPIKDWLLEMLGSPELVQFVRAFLNAIVCSRTDLQSFLELVGPGGTGKSSLIRLAQALVGVQNTHTTSLSKLENDKFETANIYGKKLVIISDSERYGGQVSMFKALTGQDTIPFEIKFKQAKGGITPDAMVIVAANEIPQCADYTSGLQRRRKTISMLKQIPEINRRDLITIGGNQIGGEFAPYIPGLLNWVLELTHDDVNNIIKNYDQLSEIRSTKADALLQTNPIADWLDSCLILDIAARSAIGIAKKNKETSTPNHYLNVSTWLYASYCEYAQDTGTKAVALRRFVNLLEDLTVNQLKLPVVRGRDRNGAYFMGIRIRRDTDKDLGIISGSITQITQSVTVKSPCVTDSVMAETLTSDGCDGCDGKNQLISSEVKNEMLVTPNGEQEREEFSFCHHIHHTMAETSTSDKFEPSQEPKNLPSQSITSITTSEPQPQPAPQPQIGKVYLDAEGYPHKIVEKTNKGWTDQNGENVTPGIFKDYRLWTKEEGEKLVQAVADAATQLQSGDATAIESLRSNPIVKAQLNLNMARNTIKKRIGEAKWQIIQDYLKGHNQG